MMVATRKQVIHKIGRVWPGEELDQILRILDQYGMDHSEFNQSRVHLAIIKESEGRVERLPELTSVAKRDYRDIVAWAEYPEEFRMSAAEMKSLSHEGRQAILERDRNQYLRWLRE